MASDVKYDVLENVNPDLSDSEFVDIEVGEEQGLDAPTPGFDAPTPAADAGADEDEDEGAGSSEGWEDVEDDGDLKAEAKYVYFSNGSGTLFSMAMVHQVAIP